VPFESGDPLPVVAGFVHQQAGNPSQFWDRNKGTPGDLSTRKPSISRALIPEQKKLLTASRGVITNGSPKRLNEVWTSMG